MKKNELILCSVVLVVSLIGCIIFLILGKNTAYVSVAVDGKYKGRYSLNQDKEVTIEDGNGGWNELVIKDGKAYVSLANCPNLDCVHQGEISKNNQSIICLPHRLTITVTIPREEDLDEEAR